MTGSTALLDASEIARLSGLDYVKALAEGRAAAPPMNDVIPFVLVSVSEGEVKLKAEPEARFHNPMGIVHGGWLMTLLDSAMGLAALTTLDPGGLAPTHETAVKFFRPITVGSGPIVVTGRVLSRGRTTIACEGRAESAEGKLHGHGTSTCMAVYPKVSGTRTAE